jgi:hypothetical protein
LFFQVDLFNEHVVRAAILGHQRRPPIESNAKGLYKRDNFFNHGADKGESVKARLLSNHQLLEPLHAHVLILHVRKRRPVVGRPDPRRGHRFDPRLVIGLCHLHGARLGCRVAVEFAELKLVALKPATQAAPLVRALPAATSLSLFAVSFAGAQAFACRA